MNSLQPHRWALGCGRHACAVFLVCDTRVRYRCRCPPRCSPTRPLSAHLPGAQDGGPEGPEAPRGPKRPAVWQLVADNIYTHRTRKQQDEDDVMICQCPTKYYTDTEPGCGTECINRMLNIECVPVRVWLGGRVGWVWGAACTRSHREGVRLLHACHHTKWPRQHCPLLLTHTVRLLATSAPTCLPRAGALPVWPAVPEPAV